MTRFLGFVCLFGTLALAGCVSASSDALTSVADQSALPNQTPADKPTGAAQNSGQFPTFSQPPTRATSQITPAERAATEAELRRDAEKVRSKTPSDTEAAYRREVDALQREGASAHARRLRKIENRKPEPPAAN